MSKSRQSVSIHMNSAIDTKLSNEEPSVPAKENGAQIIHIPDMAAFRKNLVVCEPAEPVDSLDKYIEPKPML